MEVYSLSFPHHCLTNNFLRALTCNRRKKKKKERKKEKKKEQDRIFPSRRGEKFHVG